MPGQVDRVGDNGCRRVRRRGCPGQDSHGFGYPEREGSSAPAARRDPKHRVLRPDGRGPEEAGPVGPVDEPHPHALARRKVDRDVATIVHRSPGQGRGSQHRVQDLLGNAARDRSHWGDEGIGSVRRDRLLHAPGDRAGERPFRPIWRTQLAEFRAELIQHAAEPLGRRFIGRPHRVLRAHRIDDEIDRPVLQVQAPAIGEHADLRPHPASLRGSEGPRGQGLSPRGRTERRSGARPRTSDNLRTSPTWPPSRS